MPNKLAASLAISLMLSSSLTSVALADSSSDALEKAIMNGSASPSGNPDNIPWMNKDGSVKPSSTTSTAPVTPVVTAPSTTAEPPKSESAHKDAINIEPVRIEPIKVNNSAESKEAMNRPLQRETPQSATATSSAPKKSPMLFGRIEQLTAGAGASFPVLKAMTPKMDTRPYLKGQTQINNGELSGVVVNSFPVNYQGNWGGHMVLQQVAVDRNYYAVDPEEARRTVQAMKTGNQGDVNFTFAKSGGKMTLEPAKCLFMVPASDTQVPDEMRKMMGNNGGAMASMMGQVMNSMPVPVTLEFGDIAPNGNETSVSGNKMQQTVIKNEVRELAQGVLEEDIVTKLTTWDKRTGRPRVGYGETVVRFTPHSANVMYVQAASVNYGANRQYLAKMVLYGSVGKGVVMNTDPMSAMTQSMPGLGNLGNMYGQGAGPATNNIPQGMQLPGGMPGGLPAGSLDMLKNLFGGGQ